MCCPDASTGRSRRSSGRRATPGRGRTHRPHHHRRLRRHVDSHDAVPGPTAGDPPCVRVPPRSTTGRPSCRVQCLYPGCTARVWNEGVEAGEVPRLPVRFGLPPLRVGVEALCLRLDRHRAGAGPSGDRGVNRPVAVPEPLLSEPAAEPLLGVARAVLPYRCAGCVVPPSSQGLLYRRSARRTTRRPGTRLRRWAHEASFTSPPLLMSSRRLRVVAPVIVAPSARRCMVGSA